MTFHSIFQGFTHLEFDFYPQKTAKQLNASEKILFYSDRGERGCGLRKPLLEPPTQTIMVLIPPHSFGQTG